VQAIFNQSYSYCYIIMMLFPLILTYSITAVLQVSYAIGVSEPLSITVFDYGTSKYNQEELLAIVNKNFDLRPGQIAISLKLKDPIYQQTSTYGHFGRDIFTWEQAKTLEF